MQQRHHRHIGRIRAVRGDVGGVVVDHRRAAQQPQVVVTDGRTAVTELFEIEEEARVALAPVSRKAEVRAENDVDRVFAQPVLAQRDLGAEAPELEAQVARLVDEPQ